MTLTEEDRNALVSLYKEKADETWQEADAAIQMEKWGMAANRLYYSLFHAITALFVKDGHQVGTHLGAKIRFGQHYVKTGLVSPQQGRLFSQLESLRERADYDCFFKTTKENVEEYYPAAKELITRLYELIEQQETTPTGVNLPQ